MPKNKNYTPEQLEKAVSAVRSKTLGYKRAAKEFGVPKTTLVDHVLGRYSPGSRPGRPTVLAPKVEEQLVQKVIHAADKGFGLSKRQLLLKVSRLSDERLFKNGIPSNDWFAGLKKRHPDLVLRCPEKLTTSRARMLNSVVVEKYFVELGHILTDLGLAKRPHQIWNLDETGKQFEHTPSKVLAGKGRRSLTSRVSNSRESITVLACVNAGGCSIPPMCVVKGKTQRSLHSFATLDGPEGTFWSYQEKAWMNDILGQEWFRNVFLPNCGPERPQLLILDSHSSHEVIGLLENAVQEGITILALPPHTTHALQPLDKSVFGPFSKAYNRSCSEFLASHPSNTINKTTWPRIFRTAWEQSFTPANITAGFRSTGIHPFDPKAVSDSLFTPSLPFDKPNETPATAQSHSPSQTSLTSLDTQYPDPVSPADGQSVPSTSASISAQQTLAELNAEAEETDLTSLALSLLQDQVDLPMPQSPPVSSPPAMEVFSATSILSTLSNGGSKLINWNAELDQVFSIPKVDATQSTCKSKRRSITGHRILTSEQVMEDKREAKRLKEQLQKEKDDRQKKRAQKQPNIKVKKQLKL